MRNLGRRISPEGWAYGVLTLMFDLSASSLNASFGGWWIRARRGLVNKECVWASLCSGRKGERERGREGERRDGEGGSETERERGREGERVLMLEPSTSYFNAPWWMVDSCTASVG